MSKKILSALMALVLLISLVPAAAVPARAANDSGSVGGFTWTVKGDTLSFTAKSGSNGTLGGFQDAAKAPWYKYRNDIKRVALPSDVKKVGKNTLTKVDCPNLDSIAVQNVESLIGITFLDVDSPMSRVHNLYSMSGAPVRNLVVDGAVAIPDGFFNGFNFEKVTIGGKVTEVGAQAFSNCLNLKEVVISGSPAVDANAFLACPQLQKVTVSGKPAFGANVFANNKALVTADLKGMVTPVGEGMFKDCNMLETVMLPSKVEDIGANAFSGCVNLKSVNLGKNLKTIGANAFRNCERMEILTLPKTVTSIGKNAFAGCTGLQKNGVHISDLAAWCKINFNGSNPLQAAHHMYVNSSLLDVLTIPDGVHTVSDYAFAGNTSLKKIIVPGTVDKIGPETFTGCENVVSVEFATVQQRKKLAASMKDDLTNAEFLPADAAASKNSCGTNLTWEIKDNVLIISGNGNTISNPTWDDTDESKKNLEKVTRIVFPENIIRIENDGAFEETLFPALREIETKNLAGWCKIDFMGQALLNTTDKKTLGRNLVVNGAVVKDLKVPNVSFISADAFHGANFNTVSIPGTVKTIGDRAFSFCRELSKLNIASGVQEIGAYAFAGDKILGSVKLPGSVETIGGHAFENCSALTSLSLNEGLKTIGEGAFNGSHELTAVRLPSTLTKLGASAFQDCSKLSEIDLPKNLATVSADTFKGCTGLKRVGIPSSVRTIEAGAFDTCTGLTRVDITDLEKWCTIDFIGENPVFLAHTLYLNGKPAEEITLPNVTHISPKAFHGCLTLTEVTIPDTVKVIGNLAFQSCDNLKKVIVKETTWQELSWKPKANDALNRADKSFEKDTAPVDPPFSPKAVSEELVNLMMQIREPYYTETARETFKGSGVYMIGYGTPSEKGFKISRVEAKNALRAALEIAAGRVWYYTPGSFYPDQPNLDALAGFTFLSGHGWLSSGQPLYDAITASGDFLGAICAQSVNKSKGYLDACLILSNLYINGVYSTTIPANYAYVNLDPNGGISSNWGFVQGYDMNLSNPVNELFEPEWKNNEMEFVGWYTGKTGGTQIRTLDASTNGKTLYAHWQKKDSGTAGDKIVGKKVSYRLPADFAVGDSRIDGVTGGRVRVFDQPASSDVPYDELKVVSVLDPNTLMQVEAEYRYPDTERHLWLKLKDSGWVDVGDRPAFAVEHGVVKMDPQKRLPVHEDHSDDSAILGGLRNGDEVSVVYREMVDDIMWGITVYLDTTIPNESVYRFGWIRLAFVDMTGAADPEQDNPDVDVPDVIGTGVVANTDQVNIRKNPNPNSTKVGTYPRGEKLEFYDYSKFIGKTWGQAPKGWVCLDYVALDAKTPDSKPEQEGGKNDTSGNVGDRNNTKILASGNVMNNVSLTVRKGPGNQYERDTQILDKGARVHIYQTKMYNGAQWGRIHETDEKWACMTYIVLDGNAEIKNPEKPGEPSLGQGMVYNCTPGVNLRATASASSAFLGILPVGTVTDLLEETEVNAVDWYRTPKGWTCGLYVKKVDMPVVPPAVPGTPGTPGTPGAPVTPGSYQQGVVYADRDVNVRVLPGVTGHAVVTTLRPGVGVKIYDQQQAEGALWYKIDQGWIAGMYVQLSNANNGGGIGTTVTPGGQYVTATVLQKGGLPILAGAGAGYKQVGKYDYSSTITVLEQKMVDNVAYGRTDKGWVDMRQLSTNGTGITGTGTMATVINCSHSVRVRNAPNGIEIGNIRLGSRVEVLEVADLGGGVKVGRTPQGWVNMNYLMTDAPIVPPTVPQPTTPDAKPDGQKPQPSNEGIPFDMNGKIKVPSAGSVIPLRMVPGQFGDWDAEVSFPVDEGGNRLPLSVKITKLVSLDGTMWGRIEGGWVDLKCVNLATYAVAQKAQLVYKEHNTNVAVGALNQGTTVNIQELFLDAAQKVWGLIDADRWIELTDITKAENYEKPFMARGVVTSDATKVYAEASAESEKVAVLNADNSVMVTQLMKDTAGELWGKVTEGWVPMSDLTFNIPTKVMIKAAFVWADADESALADVPAKNQGEAVTVTKIVLNSSNVPMGQIGPNQWIHLSEVDLG